MWNGSEDFVKCTDILDIRSICSIPLESHIDGPRTHLLTWAPLARSAGCASKHPRNRSAGTHELSPGVDQLDAGGFPRCSAAPAQNRRRKDYRVAGAAAGWLITKVFLYAYFFGPWMKHWRDGNGARAVRDSPQLLLHSVLTYNGFNAFVSFLRDQFDLSRTKIGIVKINIFISLFNALIHINPFVVLIKANIV